MPRPGVQCSCGWQAPSWVLEQHGITTCLGCGDSLEGAAKVIVGRVSSYEAEVRAEHYRVSPAAVEAKWPGQKEQASKPSRKHVPTVAPAPSFGQDEQTKALQGITVETAKEVAGQ